MGEAVFGILGVAVGATIAAASNCWLARAADKRAEAKELVAREIEVRRAARIVGVELVMAAAVAEVCRQSSRWWNQPEELRTDAWERHHETLAARLTDEQWDDITAAVIAMGLLQEAKHEAAEKQELAEPLEEEVATAIARYAAEIEAGRHALEAWVPWSAME